MRLVASDLSHLHPSFPLLHQHCRHRHWHRGESAARSGAPCRLLLHHRGVPLFTRRPTYDAFKGSPLWFTNSYSSVPHLSFSPEPGRHQVPDYGPVARHHDRPRRHSARRRHADAVRLSVRRRRLPAPRAGPGGVRAAGFRRVLGVVGGILLPGTVSPGIHGGLLQVA